MKLSVIIVNYNVKYFLEQCLYSVQKSMKNIKGQLFVVDNNSVDGSCKMIKERFPEVILIENDKNTGFSHANNQALRLAMGEYILLLNPDTLVEEATLEKCINFMDKTPNAGGLSVKLIDGKGKFLPESKRALPTPVVAFFKIFGLSKIFPKSRLFGKYNLGYLNKNEIHKIEILPGAFMFLRKKAINEVGLLDEDFFMYGEDIDLSFRLIKAGYENFYFPETTIIHYKGQSTKKSSLNYVLQFYKAMIIFANKHFTTKNAKILNRLIHVAIYFRAVLSLLKRFYKQIFLPVADIVLIYIGFYFLSPLWASYKFTPGSKYPGEFLYLIVPFYILTWIFSILIAGGYEKPIRLFKLFKGILLGTIIILIIYALLPLHLRFSRALILMGAFWTGISLFTFRFFLNLLNIQAFKFKTNIGRRIAIIGKEEESKRVRLLLGRTNISPNIIGFVNPGNRGVYNYYLGTLNQIEEIVTINNINEIIFCARDIPANIIIRSMVKLTNMDVAFKIAPPESLSIIGSNTVDLTGDLYLIELNSISKRINKRNKRILDLLFVGYFIIFMPVLIFFVKNKNGFFRNLILVTFGRKSWVGYFKSHGGNTGNLPFLKKGVLTPVEGKNIEGLSEETIDGLNFIYAKDYKLINDVQLILKGLKNIGN
jgi:GT2 family glycosyltransferase